MLGQRFATRINSFACDESGYWPGLTGTPTLAQMICRATTVPGLSELDLNYPDLASGTAVEVAAMVADCGLTLNGLAMRHYSNPAFIRGAFTNPDRSVRREAIDLTKRGLDAARAMGAPMMTLWLGQDGYDYAFQCDYARPWADKNRGIAEIAAHNPDCMISIEYKPNEPRAYSIPKDAATTLIAIGEVGAANLCVTLDFAHALYADEQPVFAAAMIQRRSHLLGLHLNHGHAKRDDGLIVGAEHPQATLELLREVHRGGHDGAICFDTFSDASGLDPMAECAANIRTVQRRLAAVAVLDGDNRLAGARRSGTRCWSRTSRSRPWLPGPPAQELHGARPFRAARSGNAGLQMTCSCAVDAYHRNQPTALDGTVARTCPGLRGIGQQVLPIGARPLADVTSGRRQRAVQPIRKV